MLSLWFCQYRWCTDENNLLTASSWSVRELCLYLCTRWKEFIACHASLSLLRFDRSQCLPYLIFAGILLQWVCFNCDRRIGFADCSRHPWLQCSLLLWEACWGGPKAGRATVWQTPLLWSFTGDHVLCAALLFASLLLTWIWIFSHLTPFSLIKLLDAYCWTRQE